MHTQPRAGADESRPTDLLDLKAVCAFFGGNRPLHPATLYRGVAKGCYPGPIKTGPNTSRWLASECAAKLAEMIARRAGQ